MLKLLIGFTFGLADFPTSRLTLPYGFRIAVATKGHGAKASLDTSKPVLPKKMYFISLMFVHVKLGNREKTRKWFLRIEIF